MRPTVPAQITPANKERDDKNYHYIYVCVKGKGTEEGPIYVEEKKEEEKK